MSLQLRLHAEQHVSLLSPQHSISDNTVHINRNITLHYKHLIVVCLINLVVSNCAMDAAMVFLRGEHPGETSSHHWSNTDRIKPESLKNIKRGPDDLPIDPREWSRSDVANWLSIMASKHRINDLECDRFPMNGKGLCLMSVDMYLNRVPLGGKLLFRDFQIRLAKAMYKT